MTSQKNVDFFHYLIRYVIVLVVTCSFSMLNGKAFAANLTLAWDANSEPDLVGYRVYCGESSGNYTVNHDITSSDPNNPPPTTHEFTGLKEGTKYYFAAKAISQTGESAFSQEIRYTVPAAALDPDGDGDGMTEADGDCDDTDAGIYLGAPETCGDGIDQDCNGADLACPNNNSLIREAQSGDLDGDFKIVSDSAAASGQSVFVPEGVGDSYNGPDENQKVTFTFNIAKRGAYRIKGTVYAPNGNGDSFWVKVNGSPAGGYLWDVLQNTSYRQDYVNDRNGADPVEVTLYAGVNTVAVYLREDGTRLESIELEAVAAESQETDGDGDGLTDSQEEYYNTDPHNADTDGDGLTDAEEVITYHTDPNSKDTDGDGFLDGEEVMGGFDPADQSSKPADGDGDIDYRLIQEAEEGDLYGGFEISSDSAASGGRYVHVSNGWLTSVYWPDERYKIGYTFNIPVGGTYRIKGSVYAASDGNNSFWVKVNDSPAGGYLWDVLQNTSYQQDYVNNRNGADPVEVWLPAGENTITVYLRENRTRLDRIELELIK